MDKRVSPKAIEPKTTPEITAAKLYKLPLFQYRAVLNPAIVKFPIENTDNIATHFLVDISSRSFHINNKKSKLFGGKNVSKIPSRRK